MPATITFTRPSFRDDDSLPPATFNACAVLSGTVPDAEAGAHGVLRLAGDLTGTAAAPVLTATGATAGSYGVNVLAIPQLTVDAKGRITAVADRALGTAYGKSVIESADAATARAVLGLGGTTFLDAVYVAVMSRQYPVGEMLITRRSANPNTWLGFGTWVAYGEGKTLVGLNAAEAEFDLLDKTGGAKTHTLAAGEIPSHTHSFSGSGTTSVAGAHAHTTRFNRTQKSNNATPYILSDPTSGENNNGSVDLTTSTNGDHTHTVTVSGTTGSAGSGSAHNNLQPYITVFFWKRTA
jgi:microcystin-dependent protein